MTPVKAWAYIQQGKITGVVLIKPHPGHFRLYGAVPAEVRITEIKKRKKRQETLKFPEDLE